MMRSELRRALVSISFAPIAAVTLFSQTPATPLSFDVASVKQEPSPIGGYGGGCNGTDSGGQVGIPGMSVSLGRCRFVGVTARWLITYAYGGLQTGLSIDRVVGGPNWIGSTPFSVDATAGNDSATSAQLAEMVRTLLEQRFHLRFHRDARAVPGYALVVAKGGLKLRESAEGAAAGPRIRPGNISGSMPTAGLAFALSRMLGTPVTDETGLRGQYDVALTWTPDAGDVRDPRADPADAAGPSVFAAVQEMGLRLERKQTSVEFFVVDSIEMPTPN